MRKPQTLLFVGSLLLLSALIVAGCEAPATLTVVPSPTPEVTPDPEGIPGAAAKAVDLIAAWVEAGTPETEAFDYTGIDGNTYPATYEADIQPLFTENGLWFESAQACTGCHFGNTENSYHEMDLSSYAGIMIGGDALSSPPGVPLFGQSEIGATDYDWDHSKLKERLRNNRMPPGWEFDITEANRDGPCLEVSDDGVEVELGEYDCDLHAMDLIGAWVEAGAPESDSFEAGGAALTFERDVLPFFTEPNMWFEGSQNCTGCHFGNTENSYHEMDLSSYEGIMLGGDVLSSPPGVPLLGQSEVGATDYDWDHSKLRGRLRNNRMAPGVEFDITEENRDGPLVLHGERVKTDTEMALYGNGDCEVKAVDLIAAWVEAGTPETEAFAFADLDSAACEATYEADIQPLFTENGLWFESAQACTGCHFGNTENSYHEMDLSSYAGIMIGGDALSSPPGVPLFGQSEIGATDYDWDHSKLKERLRNNRMPPGWEFDITEANRDGPCLEVSDDGVEVELGEYDCDLHAMDLIGAWVEAGAPESDSFEAGGAALTFERDVLPFFTEPNMWFEGSQNCTGCHFGNTENSYHEMDLSSYEGIMLGGDVLSSPPGVPLLGQSEVGATDYDWDHSKLRGRLRNNRMAPGVEFDITEENRDGPVILAGTKK
ncbi:MAG: hypothetical protein HN413_15935 [Chloroflexi bacterium]|nr:hypothetical protein [Chloroflexota bacterium]